MSIKIVTQNSREMYHDAYKFMYFLKKDLYQAKIYDEVNPLQNKKLGTEKEVWCAVAFDNKSTKWSDKKLQEFKEQHKLAFSKVDFNIKKYGIPVGVQSWVITKFKIIGKQMLVDPEYQGKGICTAMLLENGKHLINSTKENGDKFETAYIGCSQFSAPIFKNKFKIEPFSSDPEHDMYKFNVPMSVFSNKEFYKKFVKNKKINTYRKK